MEAIGFIGGAISVSAGVPQLLKCIKSGQTKDLSYITYGVSYVGSAVSIYYGASIHHKAIILINVYSLVLNSALLTTKLYFERFKRPDVNYIQV
jgi:MtN3 and saliva related transmembrane protein